MKKAIFIITMMVIATLSVRAQVKFEDYFVEKTMRVDFYHAGDSETEFFYLDEIIEEPYWAGKIGRAHV